eukprot:TRINITY_DN6709_c0_g2_i1.p1 TRINITY_DN6709_c0_g2~~TRINITY_DN6709_c0_g2_i1.p1  ORF type:complete len:132 (+),score=29.11 TRINITY_DN6709_c0_g2_i1:410-805(+)
MCALIAIATLLDPALTSSDRTVGQVLGTVGKLGDVFLELEISFSLLRRLSPQHSTEGASKVRRLVKGEVILVSVGSATMGARVMASKSDRAKLVLVAPVCARIDDAILLMRRIEKRWRVVGMARIVGGSMT